MSKLVRDKIPESIIASGRTPVTHIATDEEYHQALKTKLLEECQEYIESENPEELADILEVIESIQVAHGITTEELDLIKTNKANQRGAFTKKIILDD